MFVLQFVNMRYHKLDINVQIQNFDSNLDLKLCLPLLLYKTYECFTKKE